MADVLAPAPLARVPTGIEALDLILKGGLLSGGAYIVMGMPGVGKTTLGAQIAFHHVTQGGRALYVTLLTETHARMMQHLSAFRFFDPARVGRELSLVSAFNILETEGLPGVLGLLHGQVVDKRISLIVIDGLLTAETVAPSDTHVKKFVHELQALLSLTGCSALLLTNPGGRMSYPAHTMVDGLFELRDDRVGLRAVRRLTVTKFRGSEHLRGEHRFDISSEGIVIFPRLESLALPSPPASLLRGQRVLLGIAELDAMLGGGVHEGTSTLVLGATGSGKTLLGLKFLCTGAAAGEPGLYFGFSEAEHQLRDDAAAVRIDLARHLDAGTLEARTIASIETSVDNIAEQILEAVRARKVRRLFLDALGGLKAAADVPERVGPVITALVAHLRALGVTTLVADDTNDLFGASVVPPIPQVTARVDNILFLRHLELNSHLYRLISVIKERGSPCDSAVREFIIGARGLEVSSGFTSAEALLGGQRRKAPPKKRRGKGGRRRP